MPMDPARGNYQQKRESWWHRIHAISLSHASAELLDTTGLDRPHGVVHAHPNRDADGRLYGQELTFTGRWRLCAMQRPLGCTA